MRKRLFCVLLTAMLAMSFSGCGDSDGSGGRERKSDGSASASGSGSGNDVKGRIDTIHQSVSDYTGVYYDSDGVSFEVVESNKGVMIKGFTVPQGGGSELVVPDTPVIYDKDCEVCDGGEIHYYYQVSDLSFFDVFFYPENRHISFCFNDLTGGPFNYVAGDFSQDPSIVKQTHYYRKVIVTYDEGSHGFGDCFTHVHPVTVYDFDVLDSDGISYGFSTADGYDDYYEFLYNTETGYVESIKLYETFFKGLGWEDDWDSEDFVEHRRLLKEKILDDAEKYNITDVSFSQADYQIVITFGTNRVGKFDQFISHLLSEKQNIPKFVEDVSEYADDFPELKPGEGDNFVYVLAGSSCEGVRVEWYD
ncbi:MAG: hypothetical protein K6G57_03820 [Lachnospiraceae bacterium]|nr:hypothetical protein [Lachnospiraceae bacterium]